MFAESKQSLPDADTFVRPYKKGSLLKLVGRGWFSSGCWKKRFCVLDGTKLYYYENEKSCGSEKTSGVISLDYYDVCEQFDPKDKKVAHVFVVGTSVRGFFDTNHQFAAESAPEMQDWIRSVHDVIAEARNIRSRAGRNKIGATDKVSPVSENRIVLLSEMNDDFGEDDLKLESDQPQLLSSNKDRVRGPQGRRLPQRKSMMPMGSPSEDGVKPRSFSLSSPKEAEEEGDDENGESTPRDQKRISLSMEAVHREGMALDDSCQRSCSSSDHLSPPSSEATPAKKPVFGRLGGQHAALTKELELKLKSGLVPGGRKFHPHRAEEEPVFKSRSDSEADELEKKIDGIGSTLSSVQSFMQNLEEKFKTLKESTIDETNALVQDFITETSTTLKEIQTHNAQCKEALAEVHHIREEHRRLVHQCQEALQQLRTTQNTSQLGEKADS